MCPAAWLVPHPQSPQYCSKLCFPDNNLKLRNRGEEKEKGDCLRYRDTKIVFPYSKNPGLTADLRVGSHWTPHGPKW